MERGVVYGSYSVADVALWSGGGWFKRDGGRQGLDTGLMQALLGSTGLGPGAINYSLIEGYHGDPAVTKRWTEVVIEEGVPFSLFLSLSSPGALSAATILVLARGCSTHCLTMSIYA